MNETQSDVFVFFGATGDLAYKKIFPSLQAMVKRGHLDVPVIGMARSAKNVDELRDRMRDSLKKQGGFDLAAFGKLTVLLFYLRGDHTHPATFQALCHVGACRGRRESHTPWGLARSDHDGLGVAMEIRVLADANAVAREAVRAHRVLWFVTGTEKGGMLVRLCDGDPSIPAGRARQEHALVLADHAVAGQLGTR